MGVLIKTTNAETAYEALSGFYKVRGFSVPDDRFSLAVSQDRVGPVELHRLKLDTRCRVEGAPPGALYLTHLRRGTVTYRRRRLDATYGPGAVFLSTQPELSFDASIDGIDMEFVVLDPSFLSQVTDPGTDRPMKDVRLISHEPYTTGHAERWLATFRYVRDELGAPVASDAPLLIGSATRLLAATALATFPNTGAAEDSRQDRRDAHPETLRRAIAFMDENAHRDIGIADIAAGSHASIRSVQLAFRRHLDTTPLRYLRGLRLERAHGQLAAIDGPEESITVIAHRWGFSNTSRFAQLHRSTYGELPSQTVQRGR